MIGRRITELDQRALAEILGVEFTSPELLRDASRIDSRAFGALEHLGDAVCDLSIGVACWQAGRPASDASALVANKALDLVFHERLSGLVHARSGDVVEALVGAVHLDAGFDDAARVSVRLCAPDLVWEPLAATSLSSGNEVPAWIGSLAIDAIITDALVNAHGLRSTSQKKLSRARSAVTSNQVIAKAVADVVGRVGGAIEDVVREYRQKVAADLIRNGWAPTASEVRSCLLGG